MPKEFAVENRKPSPDASLEDWKSWALNLQSSLVKSRSEKQALQNKIKKLKGQILGKDKALAYAKEQITELTERSDDEDFDLLKKLKNFFGTFLSKVTNLHK
jgi:predicted  nucleic acid-binding Zn-ribbon protein